MNDIAQNTGVSVRTVRHWVSRLSNTDGEALPRMAIPTGRHRKTHPRTLRIMMRDLCLTIEGEEHSFAG